MSRCMSVVSVMLLFWLSGTMSAQEAKASVRVINDTEDERTVEINKFPVRIKGKSEEIVVVPPGEFTYKVIGIDTVAQKRTVKLGDTWMMTIRASVTILPPDKEKELPPKVIKTDPQPKVEKADTFDKSKQARIIIKLPSEDTTVFVDGMQMPEKKTVQRVFCTPDLNRGEQMWFYHIKACWKDSKGFERQKTYKVMFRCGDEVTVDFTQPSLYFGGCSR